jgi:hypothetical protein
MSILQKNKNKTLRDIVVHIVSICCYKLRLNVTSQNVLVFSRDKYTIFRKTYVKSMGGKDTHGNSILVVT